MVALTSSPGTGAVKHGDGYGTGNRRRSLDRKSGNGIGYGPQKILSEITHPIRVRVADSLKGDGYGFGDNGTSTGDG